MPACPSGTSAWRHGDSELCSIVNRAIREDDPNATIHAAVFANAINMLLVEDDAPQPWLQKIFQKSYPCVIGLVCQPFVYSYEGRCVASRDILLVFPCSHGRYPNLLGKTIQRKIFKFKKPLPHADRYCSTWRGGGFRDDCKEFFERMIGKFYRVPGFLATSMELNTAMKFIRRAKGAYPRILWCILVGAAD